MKIKKIEISGFKSFCDRAVIEFPPGISAVVGPNGCGKSNVIDALRWVMGEQSVKTLRGKAMEDVIFSGSNGKPPLNMAEVSLTLANDNGSAPEELKDFTEIMLTRRLYRSGESAYLLNKQPCRLKDVHNVFLGSGLGTKSYAVIQQGNIGAITEAGPEERRFFIEEAAGITRYKNRKMEALRKIDLTNQNLLRVQDIMSEIKRQMSSLKRQARKAEIYNNYQRRIQALDLHLGFRQFDEYSRQIDETALLLQELRDTDVGHSTELQKLDAAVEDIKLKRWQKNQEIADLKSAETDTQRRLDRMETDLGHLREETQRLAQESADLTAACKNLEQKNADMLSEIGQEQRENQRLREEIGDVKTDLEQKRTAHQRISDHMAQLQQSLEARKHDLMQLVTQEAQYKNIYQTAASNKENLKRRLARADEEEVRARQRIAETQDRQSTITAQLDVLSRQIQELDSRIETLRRGLQQRSQALADQVRHVHALDLERNALRSKYATLKKMQDNFEWYKDGVQAVMTHAAPTAEGSTADPAPPNQTLQGIIGLLADAIDVQPGFETAVEAALGESLQYVLVKDQQSAIKAIDYLQSQEAGRAGFIPSGQLVHEAPSRLDPVRLLINRMVLKPEFDSVVRPVIGDVVLADDLQEAVDIFNRDRDRRPIVTKDGTLVSAQGILVGGSQDKLSGILAKKQEVKELDHQQHRMAQQVEAARQDQTALESEVRNLENELQKLISRKHHHADEQVEAEKSLYKATEDLKHARRHLEVVNLEQEQLSGEASDIDADLGKTHRVLSEISDEIKEAQQSVAELSQQLSAVSSDMKTVDQEVMDLKLKLTTLNARVENSDSSLRRLKAFQEDGLKRLEQITQEITVKHQKQSGVAQKITDLEGALSELYREMRRLEHLLAGHETDYQAIDEQLKDSDSKISEIKTRREQVLENLRLLELEQSQRQLKCDHIAQRLQDTYREALPALRTKLGQTPEVRPDMAVEAMQDELNRCRNKIANIIDVNLSAIKEYESLKERHKFLEEQRDDLIQAIDDLHKVIRKINRITQERFLQTFEQINEKLGEVFPRLFNGGTAKLIMTEPAKPLDTGVEFMIQLPGKKLTRLSLLSGGEKALCAIAFIFSIFLIRPASFCLLDEIDAPLDDANVYRFNDLLKLIGQNSQVIMITHNKRTMEFADTLFGITMEQKGISKVVSVNLQHADQMATVPA